jgi:transposase
MEKVVDFMVEQPDTNRGLKKSTLRSRHEPRVLNQTQSLVWKKLNGIDVPETSAMEPARSAALVFGNRLREAAMNRPTYYIGIDVAADTFTAAIFTSPGQPTVAGPQFANSMEGLEEFHRWLDQRRAVPGNAVLCLEATGVYAETLCYYLCSKHFPIAVEPPLKVKRAFQQYAHKNDTVDAQQIAEYAHRFYDELRFWSPPSEILEQLRVLLAAREQFVQQRTGAKNTLTALRRKPIQTPVVNDAYQETIEQLTETIDTLEQEMKRLIDQDQNFRNQFLILTSIPGIGFLLASNLLVMTHGFTSSVRAKRLASYLGIAPLQHTSGKSVFRRTQSRHFGPAIPRKLLYLAACSVVTHKPEFRKYFLRKTAEGKSPRLVLNNVANKLITLVCALIRSQQPYIPNYRSVNPLLLKTT